jgi:hypothetical protein
MKLLWSLFLMVVPLVGADVYATVNGVQRAEIWPGMPVVLEGFGARVDAMRVEVRDEKGAEVSWAWRQVAGGEGNRREWLVEGVDTAQWSPGLYRVTVAGASEVSTACRLRVVARPDAPGESGLRRELQWKVYEVRRRGDLEGALRMVEEWLAGRAEDAVGLALRAELLVETGRTVEALSAFQLAIRREEAVRAEWGSKEPAGELIRKRDELLRRLLGPKL